MKSLTSNILENWMGLRLRLVFEGILVGLVAGIVTVLYRVMLNHAEDIRDAVYSKMTNADLPSIVLLFLSLLFIGLILGFLAKKEPLIGGSGIPQVKAQLAGKLHVNWLSIVINKFIGGVLAIGAGLSLGREGPSVQLGAAIGQGTAASLGRHKLESKYLITSGASAGLAAAFNAPLAGVIFALEEMHKNFSPIVLTAAMASSLTADFVCQNFFGQTPILTFEALSLLPLKYYPYLLLLGIVTGLFGILFNRCLFKSLKIFDKLALPPILKPLIPLFIAGLLGFWLPETLGGGHHLIGTLVSQNRALTTLLILVVVKFVFTMISYGSGVPGGIFLPLLVIGALIGNIFGTLTVNVFGLDPSYLPNFIVLAMAAYFTAIVKAPITGSILITEMTGSFSHLLSMATVSMVAYVVTDLFDSKPVYDTLMDKLLQSDKIVKVSTDNKKKVIIEAAVCMGSQIDQKKIKEITWPKDCLLVGIMRGEKEIIPKGNTQLQVGDFLIVLTNEDIEERTRDILQRLACEEPS